jgi:hypothetical protein
MLETGAVIARLPKVADYPGRLLLAKSHLQTVAELRAALLLQRMGFRVRRDPANDHTTAQKRKKGVDWLAIHSGGSLDVEVKCLSESDLMRARTLFTMHVTFAVTGLLNANQSLNLKLDPAVVADGARGKWANQPRAEALALDALVAAEATGSATTDLGVVTPVDQPFAPMIGPVASDEEHEAGRLRDLLEGTSVGQVSSKRPGVVIIDTSMDRALMWRSHSIADLMGEPWARKLAAVILVADTCPGFAITIVHGPRFQEFVSAKVRGPRVCSKGHFHVDTFYRPAGGCELDERFDDYAAHCIPGRGHYRATQPNTPHIGAAVRSARLPARADAPRLGANTTSSRGAINWIAPNLAAI